MWSAFVCSKYAEMYGNRSEYKRLFELGYHVGMKFINDIKNKKIPDSEAERTPIGVLLGLSGPSTDFSIGRIFESSANSAFDEIVKEDSRGLPIYNPTQWADDKLRIIRAKNKFNTSNCALIK